MADFNSFKSDMLGRGRVDYDKVFAFQCVDLVREYFYDNFSLGNEAGGVPYAVSYWTNTPAGVLAKFDRVDGSNAREGDVVILKTLGHADFTAPGHIGIATGNINDSKVEILEQNGSTGGGSGVGPDAIRTRYVERSRVAGLLRPKNPNATTEQVQQAYRDILERDADQGGLDHYVGHYMIDFVRNDLNNSAEHATLLARKEAERIAAEQPIVVMPENYATHYTYSTLATPLDLVTRVDAHKWNLDFDDYPNAQTVAVLPAGTPFRAYGKAQRNDLGREVYYMSEDDYAKAPQEAAGINTVDLKLPDAAVIADLEQETNTPPVVPSEDNSVPVKVIPTDPNKWKQSFNTFAAGLYKAKDNAVIEDAELKLPNIEMFKGQEVPISGSFVLKDGSQFYRTKKGLQNDTWYKIPLDLVDRVAFDEISDDDLNDIGFDLDQMKSEDDARKALARSGFKKWIFGIITSIEAFFAHKKQTK